MLIVTLRLYNITPVPIRNGVRLDLKFTQEHCFDDGSTCSSSSVHKNEIKGGDYVTWEIVLGNRRVGSILLQAAVTFRDMEQESSTHKWVSGGERDDTHALTGEGAYIMDDEDEAIVDFTINCEPVTISPIASLQPCPLTFFGGIQRCVPDVGLGDTAAFRFLWSTMIFSCKISFVLKSSQIGENGGPRSLVDPKKGCVILDDIDGKGNNSSHTTSGCAFFTPDGNRILCTLAANSEEKESKTSSLLVRSDSFIALLSFVGTPELQVSFLTFVLGDDVDIVNTRSRHVSVDSSRPNSGHDFPSMTMNHFPINLSAQQPIFGHDFPPMTMGPVPTVDAS